MDAKETNRREGMILGGSLIAGIAVGLGLPGFVTHTLHLTLPEWGSIGLLQLLLISVGLALINSGITKSEDPSETQKNRTIFAILIVALLAGIVIWQWLGK